jgi:hypothetical protein
VALSIAMMAFQTLILFVSVLPFLFIYILSKKFSRFIKSKPRFFFSGVVSGALGVSMLLVSTVVRPEAFVLGSKIPFARIHTLGSVLFFIMMIFFYKMVVNVKFMLSGKKEDFALLATFFVSVFTLAIHYSIALTVYRPIDGFLASINFVLTIGSVLLFMISILYLWEIFRRTMLGTERYLYSMMFFSAYHLFYQIHMFITKVSPIALALSPEYNDIMNMINIVFVLLPAVIVTEFTFKSLKRVDVRSKEIEGGAEIGAELISFLNDVSGIIGESTMTIYRYGIEDYRKKFAVPELNDSIENERTYRHIVKYFEGYIGPVSTRIAEDIEKRNS